MIRLSALLSAIAFALAACRPGPGGPSAAPPEATQASLDAPVELMDPEEILRRTREAMAALTSFEAHMTRFTVFTNPVHGNRFQILQQVTYRYEPPDRHSYVVTFPLELNSRTPEPPLVEDGGESRRVGPHFWTRDGVDPAGEWRCSAYDIDPPNAQSYVPGQASDYVGIEESSLGARHHFVRRDDNSTSEHWIDAATFRVVRTQSVHVTQMSSDSGRPEAEMEWDSRVLSAFDTPRQIFEPGPCRPQDPTPETEGSGD